MPIRAHSLKVALAWLMACGYPSIASAMTSWTADSCGKPVSVTPVIKVDPCVVRAFDGHTLVAWRDGLAPHVALFDPASDPALGWPVGGLRLTPDSTRSSIPLALLLSDDAVLIAWERYVLLGPRDDR